MSERLVRLTIYNCDKCGKETEPLAEYPKDKYDEWHREEFRTDNFDPTVDYCYWCWDKIKTERLHKELQPTKDYAKKKGWSIKQFDTGGSEYYCNRNNYCWINNKTGRRTTDVGTETYKSSEAAWLALDNWIRLNC